MYTDYVSKNTRLPADERRRRIVIAAREAFARKGLAGARTAELAEAAGVSERLLYKHFPSKEALHKAALSSYLNEAMLPSESRILALDPSTSSLVLLTHYFVSRFFLRSLELQSFQRLAVRSLAEDGEFARYAQRGFEPLIEKLQQCIDAAVKAGDIPKGPGPKPRPIFIQSLAVGVSQALLPNPPVPGYAWDRDQLVEEVVYFALRGIHLSDRAIERHYNAKALELMGS